MRKLAGALLLSGFTLIFAAPTSAATLTLTDTFGGTETIWTLTVETGCVTCEVSLTAFFKDPDGAGAGVNAYTGTYLDAVQWVISNPNADPTDIGFLSTTAGSSADWSFSLDTSLSGGNQCGGGATDAICGEWVTATAGGGFGPIINDSTLEWKFETTFASALPDTLVSGNIRAAFNTIKNGKVKNFNTFSPGGGSFTTSTTTTTTTTPSSTATPSGVAPEPTMLTLLGAGLVLAGRRLRRKTR